MDKQAAFSAPGRTRSEASSTPPVADETIDLAGLVQSYPGPAAYVARDGRPVFVNQAGGPLAEAMNNGALATSLGAVFGGGASRVDVATLPSGKGTVTVQVMVMPVRDGALILGRDVTLDANLREALVDSRRRYKDLVEISSDFAWETNTNGEFVFVSPIGALGWRADQLVGHRAGEFVVDQGSGGVEAFATRAPLQQMELWFRRADGTEACLYASAVPLLAPDGAWKGARGVCKDVTEMRDLDAALAEARNRERLLAYIARTIRDELDPANMLTAASAAITRAFGVAACRIYRADPSGALVPAAEHGQVPVDAWPLTALPEAAEREDQVAAVDEGRALAAATCYRKAVNGAVQLWREPDSGDWADGDRDLLIGVANQLGIAHEQVANHEKLLQMSRRDGLTGLLNGRTFIREAHRRLAHTNRTLRPGALVYVDLDNFKVVNDVHGHQRGDEALKALASLLTRSVRVGDLVARLGGDEFALWLEDTDEIGGEAKAKALLAMSVELKPYSGDEARPLGLSVGLAVYRPERPESYEQLVARSDAAMYATKRPGKGSYTIAPAAESKDEAL